MLLTRRHLMGGLGAATLASWFPRAHAGAVKPYVHFCMNTHDWGHAKESAAQMVKLSKLFSEHGVKGDFFVNTYMVDRYAKSHPEAVTALQAMTVSYANRPPHPLYTGFSGPLAGLSGEALEAAIRDYETFAIDQSTGQLDRTRPGGYVYSTQVFGAPPVAVTTLNPNREIRAAAARVYKALGAQVTLAFHEEESEPDNPWQTLEGLVVRPSHIGIVKYGGSKLQWWNNLAHGQGDRPLTELERRLGAWTHAGPPFVTILMHENDFYRAGVESWTYMYWNDQGKKSPKSPPYNLSEPDPSRARKAEAVSTIWSAYSDLVAWAAKNANVITSADLPKLMPSAAG